jgi:hypothetical protein
MKYVKSILARITIANLFYGYHSYFNKQIV